MSVAAVNSEAMRSIMKILGLPKYTRSFTLNVHVGEIPTVMVTYLPEETINTSSETLTQEFLLIPKDKQ